MSDLHFSSTSIAIRHEFWSFSSMLGHAFLCFFPESHPADDSVAAFPQYYVTHFSLVLLIPLRRQLTNRKGNLRYPLLETLKSAATSVDEGSYIASQPSRKIQSHWTCLNRGEVHLCRDLELASFKLSICCCQHGEGSALEKPSDSE